MELCRLFNYALILTILTDSQSQIVDDVMYQALELRIDGLLFELSKVAIQQKTLEERLDERKCGECTCCKEPDINSNTSEKLKDEEPKEKLMNLKRAFASEKKYLREFVEVMEKKIEKKLKHVSVETIFELGDKVNFLEKEKVGKRTLEEMQRNVSALEKSLKSVQSNANDSKNRATMMETNLTRLQDSSLEIERRLDDIETNVSSVMETIETKRRKVSFTAQVRGKPGVAIRLKPNKIIPFNYVFYNDGEGFNVSSGIFTVPVAGVYQFIFFVEGWQESKEFVCRAAAVSLYIDHKAVAIPAIADPRQAGQHIQAGNAYINYFNKGQRVLVGTAYPCKTTTISAFRTTFSGTLLY